MQKKGNNIYKRKDGFGEDRYQKGCGKYGKIIYGYICAKTYTRVKNLLNYSPHKTSEQKPLTISLAKVSQQWLSFISLKVKPSTLAEYDSAIKLHILPMFGEEDISKINTMAVSTFAQMKLQNGRKDNNGGLAPKTVRDILSILKGIIDFASGEKLIANTISMPYPKQQQKSMRVLSNSEQVVLRRVLLENITIHKIGILLCLYTGLRVGEVCGLRWGDFSPNFDKLSVRQSVRRVKNNYGTSKTKLIIDSPKSKSSVRDIPIPEFIIPFLMEFKYEEDTHFLSTSESSFIEPRTMQNHFKRVIEAAGVTDANFHCLRHTFATLCIEAGVDIKSLSEILGHASVNITLNRYVHSTFDQKRESINKLSRHLDL